MAQAKYELRIYNAAGALQYIVNDATFTYTLRVNAPGFLQFSIDDTHPAAGNLDRDYQVEVHRQRAADSGESNGIARYVDFYGLVRDEERRADGDGNSRIVYYCPGQMDLLKRAIVAYPSGVDLRSDFTSDPAETVMKNLVKYNLTSSGTTGDGRVRNADETSITIEADGAGGNSIDYACAWRNVLSALQEVAQIGGGDFDLVKTAAATWDFRYFSGQLGTDRSASVIFALQYGNMANPTLRRNWLNETTVAIVGGQGEAGDRTVEVRTGTNYDSGDNSLEVFVDARDLTTTTGLQKRGDISLEKSEARDDLQFDVIQTPGSLYGLHYFLGDKVTGYYQGITATKKIVGVTVGYTVEGVESIYLETRNV